MIEFKVKENDMNQTIFNFIKKNYKNTSLSVIYKWFRTGKIKINDKKIKDLKYKLQLDDVIKVFDKTLNTKRDEFNRVNYSLLKIIYEDDNILVIDKPSNLEVHSPVNLNLDDIVKSYLIDTNQYDPDLENSFVISHVHRLDKLTKGLVIYGKNKITLDILLQAIKEKDKIEKFYLLKTINNNLEQGVIKGFITYDANIKKAIFKLNKFNYSKPCKQIIENIGNNIYQVQLITGRKHQIRVICDFYNSPINNDFRYGAKRTDKKEIDLIAYKLKFKDFEGPLSYLNGLEIVSNYSFKND